MPVTLKCVPVFVNLGGCCTSHTSPQQQPRADDESAALPQCAQPNESAAAQNASGAGEVTDLAASPSDASLSPVRRPSSASEAPPPESSRTTGHTTTSFATDPLPGAAAALPAASPADARAEAPHSGALNGEAAAGDEPRRDTSALTSAAADTCGDSAAPPAHSHELQSGCVSMQLERTGALLSSMDLAASMRQKHGWSAPWLPGLWLMPDGSLFGAGDASCSLLLALQLYFEKEAGVEWRCPVGVASAERARAPRRRCM